MNNLQAPLSELNFPALYQSADQNSLEGQHRFLLATRIRLIAIVAAAGLGLLSIRSDNIDVSAAVAAVAFGIAIASELYIWRSRPDSQWYRGRAGAESAKTLTWRYIVGGDPFPVNESRNSVDMLLLDRLRDVAAELEGVDLVPAVGSKEQITDRMRETRELPLESRITAYRTGRIEDQRDWYALKARWNKNRANLWSLLLVGLETAGLTASILKLGGVWDVDLAGVIGTAIGGGVAWLQAKQHQTLASAYSVAAHELMDIHSRMSTPMSEAQWASFVDQAEEAISREHTMWKASHS